MILVPKFIKDLLQNMSFGAIQRFLIIFFPITFLFKFLFNPDFEYLYSKMLAFLCSYNLNGYLNIYPIVMKGVAVAASLSCVFMFLTALLSSYVWPKMWPSSEYKIQHYQVIKIKTDHFSIQLNYWYWILLAYGLTLRFPVYWYGDRWFLLLFFTGLMFGPIFMLTAILQFFGLDVNPHEPVAKAAKIPRPKN